MEALLEKEGNVESWNDERLDELRQTMKEGFVKSDRETKEGFTRIDRQLEKADRETTRRFGEVDRNFGRVEHEFGRITDRLDKLFYIQLFFLASLAAALLTDKA
jgi:hypothetical protein